VQRGNACCGSPGRDGPPRTFSRVGFLGAGLASAVGGLGAYAMQAAAAETVQVWGLDTTGGSDHAGCDCSACAACIAHAANKLFSSAAVADAGRAHPHCKCVVVSLGRIDEGIYRSLFVAGGGRDSVDRRYQWVQAVLTHDPPSVMRPARAPARVPAVRTAPSVQAILVRVRPRHGRNGSRWLYVDLEAEEVVTVGLSLTREGPVIARRVTGDVSGSRRIKLLIPPDAQAGTARLRVRLHNSAGAVKIITRSVRIPQS
jgi:hypothetical protein